MIGEPPLLGASQEIITLVFENTEVVGAIGVVGFAAALIITSDELILLPTKLRAEILNV